MAASRSRSTALLIDDGDGTLIFTPNASFLTTDTFTYTVSDGSGAVDTATVTLVRGPVGRWDFDNPANLTAATLGNPLVSVGTDDAIPGIGTDDGAVRLGVGDYYIVDHDIAPNGGGSKVNEYTLVYDFQVPTVGPWACFFQTDATNARRRRLFRPQSERGHRRGPDRLFDARRIAPATWYRLAVVVDNASRYNIYLDGTKILTGVVQTVDGRFSLGETLLVCADNNGEDNTMDVSMFSIFDRPLSDAEVALLGGPFQSDPDNTPPAVVVTPAGPASTTTRTDVAYTFHADDADGDHVQFQIDWGDGSVTSWSAFQSSADRLRDPPRIRRRRNDVDSGEHPRRARRDVRADAGADDRRLRRRRARVRHDALSAERHRRRHRHHVGGRRARRR